MPAQGDKRDRAFILRQVTRDLYSGAVSWSGLFGPRYTDLPMMGFHGILVYGVNFAMSKAGLNANLNNFASACTVTFSAFIMSRFGGHQAVGNTVAGLWVLSPGAYLVKAISTSNADNSFSYGFCPALLTDCAWLGPQKMSWHSSGPLNTPSMKKIQWAIPWYSFRDTYSVHLQFSACHPRKTNFLLIRGHMYVFMTPRFPPAGNNAQEAGTLSSSGFL